MLFKVNRGLLFYYFGPIFHPYKYGFNFEKSFQNTSLSEILIRNGENNCLKNINKTRNKINHSVSYNIAKPEKY